MIMRHKKDSVKIAEKLKSVLGKDYIERVSREEKFVQRNRNLGGMAFLGTNLNSVGSDGFCSLTEQCGGLLKDYDIIITKKALNDRFNEYGVKYMKRIFEATLSLTLSKKIPIEKLSSFTGIFIKDATGKQLPECYMKLFKGSGGSASKAGLKVDFSYNILSDDMPAPKSRWEMEFRDGASSDANSPLKSYPKGSIHVWDLGYFNTGTFEQVSLSSAFF